MWALFRPNPLVLGHSRYKKLIAHPALPAPSRRRCCHRARRGQSQPADGRDGRLGLSCDGCAQPKVERVDARPTSTQRQCRGEATTSMDCGKPLDPALRARHRFACPAHSVMCAECAGQECQRWRRNAGSKDLRESIDVVASPHTDVGWRQLELISARSCALTLWILGTDAHATYAGVEAAPVAHCGP